MLLDEKDFELITIKEICSAAGMNRSTFYLHYGTVSDLLAEYEYSEKGRMKQTENRQFAVTAGFRLMARPFLSFLRQRLREMDDDAFLFRKSVTERPRSSICRAVALFS